jgi:pimeloyl-ACP methyl ester carboxylesterase
MDPTTFAIRDQKQDRAIVLIHGFSGESHSTFGMMPAFLAGNPELYSWDIHCFGYPTALRPDVTGVWAADPDLNTLAGFLITAVEQTRFDKYRQLALIGHSMGGLIIQRALLDGSFTPRVSHLALFGTPSNGLKKAGLGKLFKRQVRDMDRDGAFIRLLRSDWTSRVGENPPFSFRVVAGIRDDFVPPESSVYVFKAEHRSFVAGNHLEIVKPDVSDTDSMRLLLNLLTKPSEKAVESVSAATAELNELLSHHEKMNDKEREELAYRLEAAGRDKDAIELLESLPNRSTNLTGVLAGRLKRRWLADPALHAADGPRAEQLYREAYNLANSVDDHAQVSYNGVNYAFMTLALGEHVEEARTIAADVLKHTFLADNDPWARVTQGEAYLYLGQPAAAILAYSDALKSAWTPRELDSIKRQAVWAARLANDRRTEQELEALFDQSGLQP